MPASRRRTRRLRLECLEDRRVMAIAAGTHLGSLTLAASSVPELQARGATDTGFGNEIELYRPVGSNDTYLFAAAPRDDLKGTDLGAVFMFKVVLNESTNPPKADLEYIHTLENPSNTYKNFGRFMTLHDDELLISSAGQVHIYDLLSLTTATPIEDADTFTTTADLNFGSSADFTGGFVIVACSDGRGDAAQDYVTRIFREGTQRDFVIPPSSNYRLVRDVDISGNMIIVTEADKVSVFEANNFAITTSLLTENNDQGQMTSVVNGDRIFTSNFQMPNPSSGRQDGRIVISQVARANNQILLTRESNRYINPNPGVEGYENMGYAQLFLGGESNRFLLVGEPAGDWGDGDGRNDDQRPEIHVWDTLENKRVFTAGVPGGAKVTSTTSNEYLFGFWSSLVGEYLAVGAYNQIFILSSGQDSYPALDIKDLRDANDPTTTREKTYVEDTAAIKLAGQMTLADDDTANFLRGKLIVGYDTPTKVSHDNKDLLKIVGVSATASHVNGDLWFDATNSKKLLYLDGNTTKTIGYISDTFDGSDGKQLIVNFQGSQVATSIPKAAIEKVMRSVYFQSTDSSMPSLSTRSITFQVNDGTNLTGASEYGASGYPSAYVARTVRMKAVNDPATLSKAITDLAAPTKVIGTVSYEKSKPAVHLFAAARFEDPEAQSGRPAAGNTRFVGSELVVEFVGTSTEDAKDQLVIVNNPKNEKEITVGTRTGTTTKIIRFGGNEIAEYTGGYATNQPLKIKFTTNFAWRAAVERVVRSVAYKREGTEKPGGRPDYHLQAQFHFKEWDKSTGKFVEEVGNTPIKNIKLTGFTITQPAATALFLLPLDDKRSASTTLEVDADSADAVYGTLTEQAELLRV